VPCSLARGIRIVAWLGRGLEQNSMSTPLEEYKAFIDGLLGWPGASSLARLVKEWDTATPKPYVLSEDFHELMAKFTHEQRQLIADLLQEAHESGIFTVLTYLEPYTLVKNGIELAVEPFGSSLHDDWMARHEGWNWSTSSVEAAPRAPDPPALEAQVTAEGWVSCPGCGWKFNTHDRHRWVDGRHRLCGQRLILVPMDAP